MNQVWKIILGLQIAVGAQSYRLVTPMPSQATQSLADYIYSAYGKKIISGQMDEKHLDRIIEASEGKQPAIMGYDFYGIKPGTPHGDPPKAIRWAKEKGGIVTFSWHWSHPDGSGEFNNMDFDLPRALADTGNGIGKSLVADLHATATELARLRDAGVPVLWRPLHEAEGSWFWWGKDGTSCKQLYRLMFDIFTKQHKLDNLIWIWTSYAGEKDGKNWYPGDDVVDMVVFDYPDPYIFNKFKSMFGDRMMYGIGEVGKLPDPSNFNQAPFSYFLCWDYMILKPGEKDDQGRGGQNELSWIKKVYNDPLTITLADVPHYLDSTADLIPLCSTSQRCEAENAKLYSVSVSNVQSGFSGIAYVEGFSHLDSLKRIEFEIEIPATGTYKIDIGYASPFGQKSFWLTYEDKSILDTFALTKAGFEVTSIPAMKFSSGKHRIGISYGNGYYFIDWIEVRPVQTTRIPIIPMGQDHQPHSRQWNILGQRYSP